MDYTENYQDKYIFHYTKSKWKTDYNDLMIADLRQVIRRKSCICKYCGGPNKHLDKVITTEILNEPVFPYIKSKEEIEYENRIKKR